MLNILKSIKLSGVQISKQLRHLKQHKQHIKKINKSGDTIKELDCISNKIFINNLSKCKEVYELVSEEEESRIILNNTGTYTVAFDPLDGSDNIEINGSVGSLFCIFDKNKLSNGRDILSSGYINYGPVTQLVIATEGVVKLYNYSEVVDIFVDASSDFYEGVTVPDIGKCYSNNDGNNRLLIDEKIKNFLYVLMMTKSLRYSGCLVADLHRLLFRGGCFIYPGNSEARNGKLRLLYEAYPAAYIIETATGYSRHDNSKESILDIPFPTDIHCKTPVILMGKSECLLYDTLL